MSDFQRILHCGTVPATRTRIDGALADLSISIEHHALLSTAMDEQGLCPFGLLLLEIEPDTDTDSLLASIRQRHPQLLLVAIVRETAVHQALAAVRSGANEVAVLDEQFEEQLRRLIVKLLLDPLSAGIPASRTQTPRNAPDILWQHGICSGLLDETDRFIEANPALEQLLHGNSGSLIGKYLPDFVDLSQKEQLAGAEIGNAETCFVATIHNPNLLARRLLIGLSGIQHAGRQLRLLQARDVTSMYRSSVLADSQARLVEMILAGVELDDLLATITSAVGNIHPGFLCAILTTIPGQTRLRMASPGGLDRPCSELLDGQEIGESGSCCSVAAWTGRRVSGNCVSTDEDIRRQLASLGFNCTACSAQPIISASGGVLGTLVIYSQTGQQPGSEEFQTMEIAANLAGVAMDRINAEQARVKSDARFRNLFEHSPLAMQVYAPDGQALRGNRVWQHMFGSRQDEFADYNILQDKQIAKQGLLSYIRRGFAGVATELPLLRQPNTDAGGTPLPILPWTRTFIYSIDDSAGRPVEVILVHEDMSERRIAEESLRHSEDRLRSLVEGADDLIFTVSRSGILSAINAAFEQSTSHSIASWIGRNPLGLVHPADRRAVHLQFLEAMRGLHTAEIAVRFSCGVDSFRSGSLSAIPIIERGLVCGAFFTLRDDTERRMVEEERLRLLTAIEKVDEMIVITDPAGRMMYVNPAFERISGYQFSEIQHFTARILRSDEHDDAFFAEMWQRLGSGLVWRGEMVNRASNGKLFRVDAAITPIMSSHGEIINYVGVLRDITLKTRLEQRLQHTQKMEAIGSLAGGIAHDFNNILSAIIGYTQIVKRDLPEHSRVQANLDSVIQASMRASDLVRQILTFSQHRESRREAVSLYRIVREVLKLIRASLPSTIEIHQSLIDQSGTVLADASQLHQLVMNLCTNAGQAMEESGGILALELDQLELTDPQEAVQLELALGCYQVLKVSDNGMGMDEQTIKRIFEPFYTTKETGRGTGLGLSVVHGIVSKLGGAIRVESKPGAGSVFSVLLPRSEQEEFVAQEPDFRDIRGSERVLLVDDEQIVASMAEQALLQLGYQVAVTTSSEEALHMFSASPDAFDVVITDQTMPGLTGVQLTQELHLIRPQLPVVLCTGFSRSVSRDMAAHYGISAFLEKPTSTDRLAATIRQVLTENKQVVQALPVNST